MLLQDLMRMMRLAPKTLKAQAGWPHGTRSPGGLAHKRWKQARRAGGK